MISGECFFIFTHFIYSIVISTILVRKMTSLLRPMIIMYNRHTRNRYELPE